MDKHLISIGTGHHAPLASRVDIPQSCLSSDTLKKSITDIRFDNKTWFEDMETLYVGGSADHG